MSGNTGADKVRSGTRRGGGYYWDKSTLEQRRRARLQRLEKDNYTQLPEFDNITIAVEAPKRNARGEPGKADSPHTNAAGMVRSSTSAITIGTADEGLKRLNRKETRQLALQRRTFADMVVRETDRSATRTAGDQESNTYYYLTCLASPGDTPARHFCSICGYKGIYTCVDCGMRYCSLACRSTHVDTRCLKHVV